jgi:hypothetical protein
MNAKTPRLVVSLLMLTPLAVPALQAAPVLANPGFESGSLSPWIYSVSGAVHNTTDARTGIGCVAFTGGNSTVLQKVTGLLPNTQYKLVGYGKIGTPTTAWIGVNSHGGAQIYGTVTGTTYQPTEVLFTTGGTNTSAIVWMGNGGSGTAYGDDFSVSQVIVPLSDPQNTNGWVINSTFTDEFNGTALDTVKWKPQMDTTYWLGRAPSQFDPNNVSVSGGLLHLLMVHHNLIPNGNFEAGNLSNWTTVSGNPTIKSLYNGGADAPSDWWYGVKLDPGTTIEQTITGLTPNTSYTLAGKFKIGTGTPVTLTVKNQGAAAKSVSLNIADSDAYNASTGALQWVLRSLTFTTGPSATSATISVSNASSTGVDYCDEISVVPYYLANGFRLSPGRYLTASALQSNNRPVYGYYEARMKAANAASSSSFWFQAPAENGQRGVELDVCELVGNPLHVNTQFPNYERLIPMNTHYFPSGGDIKNPAKHDTGVRVADDFHVYGVDWQADQIIFYFDGAEIHRITQLQPPLVPTADGQTQVQRLKWLLFDTEIFSFYGIPTGSSDFQVDYIRAWTK